MERLLLKVKTIGVILVAAFSLAFGLIFGVYLEKNNPKRVLGGLPVGENELKDGQVYVVENFSLSSWGHIAQLKETDALVSRQYRVTTIAEMESGAHYKVQIIKDPCRALGVRAEFKKMPKI